MRIALASSAVVIDGTFDADQDDDDVAAALAAHGVDAAVLDWRDGNVDWGRYDGVVIRSTWDYTDHLEEFLVWTRAVEAAGTLLLNPADVVAWNVHKGYLIELEERGAPIVPTAWLGQGDDVELASVAAARGWDGVVAKPAIGAGAEGLLVVRPGTDPASEQGAFAALTTDGDAMVQPFVHSVAEGELSVVVVDGVVSHAVRKVPAAGEVRTQIEFGAEYVVEDVVDADAASLARWLVEVTGHDLAYARVDLLRDDDGTWLLGELECVEPALLLPWVPGSAGRLADAVVRRCRRHRADRPSAQ